MVAAAAARLSCEDVASGAVTPGSARRPGAMVGTIERCVVLGGLLDAGGPVTVGQISRQLSLRHRI